MKSLLMFIAYLSHLIEWNYTVNYTEVSIKMRSAYQEKGLVISTDLMKRQFDDDKYENYISSKLKRDRRGHSQQFQQQFSKPKRLCKLLQPNRSEINLFQIQFLSLPFLFLHALLLDPAKNNKPL